MFFKIAILCIFVTFINADNTESPKTDEPSINTDFNSKCGQFASDCMNCTSFEDEDCMFLTCQNKSAACVESLPKIPTGCSVVNLTDECAEPSTNPTTSPTDAPISTSISHSTTVSTTTNASTSEASKKPPIQPTTNRPDTNSSTESPVTKSTTTVSNAQPSSTDTILPGSSRRFDAPSFIGGIILSLGLIGICYVAFKFYKARTGRNYHTL